MALHTKMRPGSAASLQQGARRNDTVCESWATNCFHLQAMKGSPTTPIVRPPWNDMVTFKRLLDVGVQTLLVPYIQTEEEAQQAVS